MFVNLNLVSNIYGLRLQVLETNVKDSIVFWGSATGVPTAQCYHYWCTKVSNCKEIRVLIGVLSNQIYHQEYICFIVRIWDTETVNHYVCWHAKCTLHIKLRKLAQFIHFCCVITRRGCTHWSIRCFGPTITLKSDRTSLFVADSALAERVPLNF